MDTLEFIAALVRYLIWPIVVIVFFIKFKDQLNQIISNISEIEALGGKIKLAVDYGDAPGDQQEILDQLTVARTLGLERSLTAVKVSSADPEPQVIRSGTTIRWERSADLMIVAFGLGYVENILLRGAPKQRISESMGHTLEFSQRLGLEKTGYYSLLKQIQKSVQDIDENDLNTSVRNLLSGQVRKAVAALLVNAIENQPDFLSNLTNSVADDPTK